MSTTIRYLVRECPRCRNIIRLTLTGSKITDIEGGEVLRFRRWKKINGHWTGQFSNKTVICNAKTRVTIEGLSKCGKGMLISKFEEIVL